MDLEKVIKTAVADAVKNELQLILNTKPPVFLSTTQAAKMLQVNDETIRRLCRNGKIKYVPVGKLMRIEMRHIEQFVRENEM